MERGRGGREREKGSREGKEYRTESGVMRDER